MMDECLKKRKCIKRCIEEIQTKKFNARWIPATGLPFSESMK